MKLNKWYVLSGVALVGSFFLLKKQMGMNNSGSTADKNVNAFLKMIRWAEGTSGTDGYRTLFGGGLFSSFLDHPRIRFSFTQTNGIINYTTAAGGYQFLASTWDWVKGSLGLNDFSPANQDKAAIFLLKYRGALDYVKNGNFEMAVRKASPEWASLSFSTAPQPTKALGDLKNKYLSYGGTIV